MKEGWFEGGEGWGRGGTEPAEKRGRSSTAQREVPYRPLQEQHLQSCGGADGESVPVPVNR